MTASFSADMQGVALALSVMFTAFGYGLTRLGSRLLDEAKAAYAATEKRMGEAVDVRVVAERWALLTLDAVNLMKLYQTGQLDPADQMLAKAEQERLFDLCTVYLIEEGYDGWTPGAGFTTR